MLSSSRTRRGHRPQWILAAIGLVYAVIVSSIAITARTLWIDEFATVAASRRSFADLHALIGQIDLVHAAYYVVMHIWFDLVGYSPFTLRFPSAIAIGIATAVTVLLTCRLFSNRTAAVAALLMPLIPLAASAATTGRSPAFELLLAALATLVLVHALDAAESSSSRVRTILLWVAYALVAYVGIVVFLWFALIIVGHAMTVLVRFFIAPRRRARGLVTAAIVIVIVAAAALPFVLAVIPQSQQIGYLTAPTLRGAIESAVRTQFFNFQLVTGAMSFVTALACVSWLLVIVGIALNARRNVDALVFLLPWLILPTVLLLAASRYATPVYTSHYLTYSVPPLAILAAAGITALLPVARGAISGVLVLAFLIPASQTWWSIRYAPPTTTDFASAARKIDDGRAREAEPAGLILGTMRRPADQLTIGYPDATDGLENLSIAVSADDKRYFFAQLRPAVDAARTASQLRTVWYVGDSSSEYDQVTRTLAEEGFTKHHRDSFRPGSTEFVVKYTR
ncbi:glycosyltransferase family 39 protein [Curtobacterium sp. L1-20]|uniref:glycosyltransferase family 39 protein n=1 Tax=Curtobacterium sp. L1-20 TaxID=3138181 RepID=UPI003B529802